MPRNTRLFWSRVVKSPDCWGWSGHIAADGYAKYGGTKAHRVAYELVVGEIPAGLQLDHLCKNIQCVNPAHLEPVTDLENKRRRYADYDRCASGHPYTDANTYIRPSGHRDCRACIRERVRRYREKRAAA